MCGHCGSIIRVGGSYHSDEACTNKKVALLNLTKMATERNILEEMAFNTVTSLVDAAGEKTVQLQGPQGRPLTITVGPPVQSDQTVFTSEDARDIQIEANLSDKQVLVVLAKIRWKYGWKAVESYIREELVKRKELFIDFFSVEWISFEDKDGVAEERPFVYCTKVIIHKK